jgi:predicted lipoprotein with Yx(FWY)xxD motif
MSVSVGAGVSGHVGFLHRPGAEKQVTFNGYPLYWFAGDSAPGQDHGVGISAFGGTWLLVHAGAHTSMTTPYAAAMMSTTLQTAKVGKSNLLVNSSGRTLYLLSSEKGAKIKCSGGCLNFWPPLLVADSVTHVSVGKGVMGKVGFVARGATMKQVTVNGYPVYTYAGDTKAGTTTGEGVKALGGVWYALNPAATSAAATAITTLAAPTKSTNNGY